MAWIAPVAPSVINLPFGAAVTVSGSEILPYSGNQAVAGVGGGALGYWYVARRALKIVGMAWNVEDGTGAGMRVGVEGFDHGPFAISGTQGEMDLDISVAKGERVRIYQGTGTWIGKAAFSLEAEEV